jgi:hypothetical protein
MDSITFHYNYSADHAACCDYPFWQGFTWLSSPYSHFFQATKASFLVHPDTLIFILGILGLPWLYKKERFWAIWFFESGLFLLLWQVKWPQYSLVILIPLCFSAAEVVIQGIHLTIEKGSLFFQSKPLSTLIKHHRYH